MIQEKKRKSAMIRGGVLLSALALVAALMFLPLSGTRAKAEGTAVSTEGLAAYWKFDETEGSVTKDETEYKRDMWLHEGSTANWTEGKVGGAFRFDANSAFRMQVQPENGFFGPNKTAAGVPYQIESSKNADGTDKTDGDSSLTVSFLMKVDEFNLNTDQGFNTIFVNGNTSGAGSLGGGGVQCAIIVAEKSTAADILEYDPNREHKWLFGGVNGSSGGLSGNDNIVKAENIDDKMGGGWNLVTYVIEDSEANDMAEMTLYINGAKSLSIELSNTMGLNKVLGQGLEPLCIGGQVDAEQGGKVIRGFSGCLDEFMIYTRALKKSEIESLAVSYGLKENPDDNQGGDDNEGDGGNGGATAEKKGCGGSAAAAGALAAAGIAVFAIKRY